MERRWLRITTGCVPRQGAPDLSSGTAASAGTLFLLTHRLRIHSPGLSENRTNPAPVFELLLQRPPRVQHPGAAVVHRKVLGAGAKLKRWLPLDGLSK